MDVLERSTLGSLGAQAARTRAFMARTISIERNRQKRLMAPPKPEKPIPEPVSNIKAVRDIRLHTSMMRSHSEKWREANTVREDLAKRFKEIELKQKQEFNLKTLRNREALLAKALVKQQREKIKLAEKPRTTRKSTERSLIFSTETSPILTTLRAVREAAADSYYRRLGASAKPLVLPKHNSSSQRQASRTQTVDHTLINTNQVYSPTATMRSFRTMGDWEEKDTLPAIDIKRPYAEPDDLPLILLNSPTITLPPTNPPSTILEPADPLDSKLPPPLSSDQDAYEEVLQAHIQRLAKKYKVPLHT